VFIVAVASVVDTMFELLLLSTLHCEVIE